MLTNEISFTLALTSVVVIILPITTLLDILTLALAGGAIEVLVVGAREIVVALATTALLVEVLARVAVEWFTGTPALVWIVVKRSITCWWAFALALA